MILLPRGLEDVPNEVGGIYYFAFRLPSNYELGISPEVSKANMKKALDIFFGKRNNMMQAFSATSLCGSIKENKQNHLAMRYSIRCDEVSTTLNENLKNILINGSYDKVEWTLDWIRKMLVSSPPIYIGITSKQTLRDRLKQHLDGQTVMKESLENLGFGWHDVAYECEKINFFDSKELREVEKSMHLLHRPIFSKA